MAIKDLKLDDVIDEIRGQASKRIDGLLSEGKSQARRAGGGHDDTAVFSAFTLGLLVGALAGAAIALLLTPMSGVQARSKLTERVDQMRGGGEPGNSWEHPTGNGGNSRTGAYEPTRPAAI